MLRSWLGDADLGVADLGVADLGVADPGVADLGVANLGVADLGVDGAGVAIQDTISHLTAKAQVLRLLRTILVASPGGGRLIALASVAALSITSLIFRGCWITSAMALGITSKYMAHRRAQSSAEPTQVSLTKVHRISALRIIM